ncbi:MAG: hypothetical protein AVDCRST_MAG19-3842 [uncultured Thermomicrobiales bacterium]|uniref:Uncharacterized protein n=1 Tax=uncultured Thermomicrobiales bacterium TaxID=1645740 RepID=A0A6J4VJG0_9BACT|nr:MAG: hypothetical protein AVDCRST_MAG19-3842 [uncultured Thermomicrobiales bacterium]
MGGGGLPDVGSGPWHRGREAADTARIAFRRNTLRPLLPAGS